PLSQLLDRIKTPDRTVREVKIAPSPPEPPSPPKDEPKPSKPEPETPEMQRDPAPIEVDKLDVAINPGIGDAVAMGVSKPNFETEQDLTSEIEELFTFEDLGEAPRLINSPRFRFPPELERRGVEEGKVIVEIDIRPDGRARLRRIVFSSHHELESVARKIIGSARFTKPEVDGRPRTVRGHFPLILQNR
ncbi:MAG: energy transducer TonB, partial [Opitutales bacterium]